MGDWSPTGAKGVSSVRLKIVEGLQSETNFNEELSSHHFITNLQFDSVRIMVRNLQTATFLKSKVLAGPQLSMKFSLLINVAFRKCILGLSEPEET